MLIEARGPCEHKKKSQEVYLQMHSLESRQYNHCACRVALLSVEAVVLDEISKDVDETAFTLAVQTSAAEFIV